MPQRGKRVGFCPVHIHPLLPYCYFLKTFAHFKDTFYFKYVKVLPACMSVRQVHAEEGVKSSRSGVVDVCEPHREGWELNPGSL